MFLIIFSTVFLGFSETFEITVNKNTNYVDEVGNNLGIVSKGTVLTINSENAQLYRSSSDKDGKDAKFSISGKALYLRDITVKNNSDCLPKGIIGSTYTMNYYLKDIYNKESPKKLFIHEPYLEDFWNEEIRDDGEYFWEYFYPYSIRFYNNFFIEDDVFYSPYSRNPLFLKNIEKTGDDFMFYLIPLTYRPNVLPFYENVLEQTKLNKLKFKFEGDYLYIYKDEKLVFELVKTSEDTLEQIRNFYLSYSYDLSKVTWPRHADGSCDYDGTKKTVASQAQKAASSTNVAPNKTKTVRENLKLRSGEAAFTQVLAVMSAGAKVRILELGKAETIDGIPSNWVRVEVQQGAKDRDGKPIKKGTVGWCFGGYLE